MQREDGLGLMVLSLAQTTGYYTPIPGSGQIFTDSWIFNWLKAEQGPFFSYDSQAFRGL